MSDINTARRTDVEVYFSGVNISESLRIYLLSITYTDNEEDTADDLQIKLEDHTDIWLTSWLQQAIEAAAESITAGSSATTTTYKVTAKSGLAMRSGPSTKYKKIGSLTYGAEIEVIAIVNGWASIEYGSASTFVDSKYISSDDTSSAKSASKYTQVKYGSTGTDVKTMQTLLISIGYDLGADGATGKFDSKTLSAVKAFQNEKGLDADGVCGPFTWTALIKAAQTSAKTSGGLRIQAAIVQQNWNSDSTDKMLDCGEFELDSADASGPPSTISIKATSLPYQNSIRQTKKSRAWESYWMDGIANELAKKSGMACMYESARNPFYDRVEQITESDISFLSRLCHDAGISLKVTNNILVLFDQAAYEAKEVVRSIQRGASGGYKKWKVSTGKADTQYAICRVSYVNPATGKLIEGFAYANDYDPDKDDNQTLEISASVKSIGEAEDLAAMRLRLHNKYEKKAVFTFPGDPDLLAGNTVMLSGWGAWDGKCIISQAKHTVSSNGYETQITLRRALEGY